MGILVHMHNISGHCRQKYKEVVVMPRVIFLASLTLWSLGKGRGGPAFTNTVKKYLDEGWEVFLSYR